MVLNNLGEVELVPTPAPFSTVLLVVHFDYDCVRIQLATDATAGGRFSASSSPLMSGTPQTASLPHSRSTTRPPVAWSSQMAFSPHSSPTTALASLVRRQREATQFLFDGLCNDEVALI